MAREYLTKFDELRTQIRSLIDQKTRSMGELEAHELIVEVLDDVKVGYEMRLTELEAEGEDE